MSVGLDALKTALPGYARDTRLNLGSVLGNSTLTPMQVWGSALAAAVAARNATVLREIRDEAAGHLKPEQIEAALAAGSIMAMNTVYYRSRHLIGDSRYADMPARLRMQVIGNPGVPKADFELWSLAVAAVAGCGACLSAHEKSLRGLDISPDTVHEAIRIASVVNAVAVTLAAQTALAG